METVRGMGVPDSLEDVADRDSLALLVYDTQVGIAGRLPGAGPALERAAAVLGAARSANLRVFFCRHMSLPVEVAGAAQLRSARALQRVPSYAQVQATFLRDSTGFQIVPELAPRADEAVLDKLGMSAFAGSPLDFALRDCGIQALAVIGAVLELGIEPTVRHAVDLGYLPVVVADACVSLTQQARDATLATMGRLGVVTDSAAFARALNVSASP